MAKILVVDDEARIVDLIEKYAVFAGHSVIKAYDGETAVVHCKNKTIDLVILDVMMPLMDGFTACREIRKFSDVPVLMLTARGEEYDRINGFEIGADDYLVKPFSPRELMLRVEAILRRTNPHRITADVFTCQGLVIDFSSYIVEVDGERLDLPPKERGLLFYLVQNRNIVLTREKLLTHVWGYDFCGDDRTLDTHIKLLRKRLGAYSDFLVTVRGVGYRFETP